MTTVLLGTNSFVDCGAILSFSEDAQLTVALSPLRLSFSTPKRSGVVPLVLEGNVLMPGSDPGSRIVAVSTNTVVLHHRDVPILTAVTLSEEILEMRIDLRPLGISVFDDAQGLHVDGSTLARNTVTRCAVAIAIG